MIASRRRGGFTLMEVMVALVVFFVLASVVFNFFVGGSKYASKGAWRVHAVAAMRNGLRQVKELLEATSYPTVVRLDSYDENKGDDFCLRLASTGTTAYGTATCYVYNQPLADFVRFTACQTRNETNLAAPTGGEARRVRLSLVQAQHTNFAPSPPNPRLLDLALDIDQGTVTSRADGTVEPPTFGATTHKVICFDVESVDVIVPTSSPEGTVVHLRIHCRDPINGRMLLSEEAKASVNVNVLKP